MQLPDSPCELPSHVESALYLHTASERHHLTEWYQLQKVVSLPHRYTLGNPHLENPSRQIPDRHIQVVPFRPDWLSPQPCRILQCPATDKDDAHPNNTDS